MENYQLKQAKQALWRCVGALTALAALTTLAFVRLEWLQTTLIGCTLAALTLVVIGAQHVWQLARNPLNL